MLSANLLEKLKNERTPSSKELSNIFIDQKLSAENRLECFVKEIENPYFFTCYGYKVKISFAENAQSLEDSLLSVFVRMQQHE